MITTPKLIFSILLVLCTGMLGACGDLTGRGAAPLEHTIDVAQREQHSRVGYVYCMRGWLGIFSEGMDALADKIDAQVGTPAVSVADEEWRRLQDFIIDEHRKGNLNQGPLVLLGHSYGADDMIRVSQRLKEEKIAVDLLVLLDPVTPPKVPDNVKRVYCIYKSHPVTDWYPAWRGVPAEVENPATPIVNIDLRTTDVGWDTEPVGHVNIEKIENVHNMVMDEIRKTCPTRLAWLQQQQGGTPTVQAPGARPSAAAPVITKPLGTP